MEADRTKVSASEMAAELAAAVKDLDNGAPDADTAMEMLQVFLSLCRLARSVAGHAEVVQAIRAWQRRARASRDDIEHDDASGERVTEAQISEVGVSLWTVLEQAPLVAAGGRNDVAPSWSDALVHAKTLVDSYPSQWGIRVIWMAALANSAAGASRDVAIERLRSACAAAREILEHSNDRSHREQAEAVLQAAGRALGESD